MDPMTGMIYIVPFMWAPQDYQICNGQMMQISQNNALYSLLGTYFGGNGSTTFQLPNLVGRAPIGYGVALTGTLYQFASAVGTETSTLLPNNLPPHIHPATFSPTTGNVPVTIPATTGNLSVTATPTLTATASNVSLTVSGKAMIGSSSTTARSATIADKAVLTSSGGPAALIYAPAGTTNDRQIGPDGAITGAATGAVTSAVSGTIATTVTGNASTAAVTASVTAVNGGSVAVQSNATTNASFSNLPPRLALNFIIAVNGMYPMRP